MEIHNSDFKSSYHNTPALKCNEMWALAEEM